MKAVLYMVLQWTLSLLMLAGCVSRPSGIADLERFPQDATAYLQAGASQPLVSAVDQSTLDAEYNKRFFAPWHQKSASIPPEQAFWGISAFGNRQGYAENLLPINREQWQRLVTALRKEDYPSMARPGITVRSTSCRVFPTNHPFFLDPQRAGEGFPFDYFQNSSLWAGTPLLVTHVSTGGAWYFVETGYVAGWLPAQDLAFTDEAFCAAYQTGNYAALLQDGVALQDEGGNFLTVAHIGCMFPLAVPDGPQLQILVPVRDANGMAMSRIARVSPSQAVVKPMPLVPDQIAALANRMIGQLYGWGGLYENRDCSATLRDLFTPFGIWLPRNSADQAKAGGLFLSLADLDAEQKHRMLVTKGVPFYTLVWLKGHIGLYLGPDPSSGELMLLHNLWGVRTTNWAGREGRVLIGRLAITSLHPGEERADVEEGRFYQRILGMTVLPGTHP